MTIYKYVHRSQKSGKKYYIKIEMHSAHYLIYLYRTKFSAWLNLSCSERKYPVNNLPFPTESEGTSHAKSLIDVYEENKQHRTSWTVI